MIIRWKLTRSLKAHHPELILTPAKRKKKDFVVLDMWVNEDDEDILIITQYIMNTMIGMMMMTMGMELRKEEVLMIEIGRRSERCGHWSRAWVCQPGGAGCHCCYWHRCILVVVVFFIIILVIFRCATHLTSLNSHRAKKNNAFNNTESNATLS